MKWLDKFIVSERGQWEHPGKPTAVPTKDGRITMQGVPYPVFAMDETGYGGMIYPGGNYQFPGKMVYEIPMAQYGKQVKKSIVSAEELPEDVFPYQGTSAMFKDERYNTARAKELYEEDESGHLPSIDYETGEWLKAKRYPTSWKEFLQYALNPEVNKLGFPTENKEGFLKYPNYANGGDISIPDLSRPNWLDKAQKGQQVKYYDDPLQFKKANRAYQDSLSLYNQYPAPEQYQNRRAPSWGELQSEFNNHRNTTSFRNNTVASSGTIYFPSIQNDQFAIDQKGKNGIAPIYLAPDPNISSLYTYVYKKPTQKPVYKEKPKVEPIPYREGRLELSDKGLAPITYMPLNNTAAVLSKIKEEDMYRQASKVVPAPEFQKGGVHQKIYTDLPQFEIANQNYNDSLIVHNALKDIENAYYSNVVPLVKAAKTKNDIKKALDVSENLQKTFPKKAQESKERLHNSLPYGLAIDHYAFEDPNGKILASAYSSLDKPTQVPVYIAETRKDPYMPPSNTAEVLSQIKQEDLRKQEPKNVPAPTFKTGGWLEQYQEGSQVKANIPGFNPEVGPTVKNAQLLQEQKLQEAVRNSRQLPSGAIQPTLGPIEYMLLPGLAGSAIKKAMEPKAHVDTELEAIRKILRKNVTYPKQTGPLTETPPWPNRFLELGDDAWVIGNMERGRTSVENPDIYLPGNLPKRTPKQLPGVNGTQYPNRLPKQKNGG